MERNDLQAICCAPHWRSARLKHTFGRRNAHIVQPIAIDAFDAILVETDHEGTVLFDLEGCFDAAAHFIPGVASLDELALADFRPDDDLISDQRSCS